MNANRAVRRAALDAAAAEDFENAARDAAIVALWREPRRAPLAFYFSSLLSSPAAAASTLSAPLSSTASSCSSSLPLLSLSIGAAPLKFKTAFRNTIYSVLLERGWKESLDEVDWQIHWTSKDWIKNILPKIHLFPDQLINHFRNYYELTRKDLLIKNLKRARVSFLRAGETAIAEKFDFYPDTYNLPSEYLLFVDAFKRQQRSEQRDRERNERENESIQTKERSVERNLWIAKPIGSSQGRGIFLFERLSAIADWAELWGNSVLSGASSSSSFASPSFSSSSASNVSGALLSSTSSPSENVAGDAEANNADDDGGVERYIVQKYLHNPLLIGGKKFDMRIYVLVTNYEPLNVYIHREAFARFSTQRYESTSSSSSVPSSSASSSVPSSSASSSSSAAASSSSVAGAAKSNIHNNFMHLTNVAIQKEGANYDEISGGKLNLGVLRRYFTALYEDGADRIAHCFHLITELIYYSLLSVKSLMIKDRHCFELYGYDVLIDAAFKPWLIEVNASPSLSANTLEDELLKKSMLHDCFHVLEFERWCAAHLKRHTKAHSSAKRMREVAKHGAAQRAIAQPQFRPAVKLSKSPANAPSRGLNSATNQYNPDAVRNYFFSGEFDRVGGFDCVCREQCGGLRLDAAGRALNCLGDGNDRDTALNQLWKKMEAFDEEERKREQLMAHQAIKMAEERSLARDQKRKTKTSTK